MVIYLEWGAGDLHMVQLMPLNLIMCCSIKLHNVLPFWCRLILVVLEKRPLNECCIITEVPRDTAIQWCLKNSFELVELSSCAVDSNGSDEGFSSWSSLLCQTVTFTFCVLMMHHWLSIVTCMWVGHACTAYGFIVHFDLLWYSRDLVSSCWLACLIRQKVECMTGRLLCYDGWALTCFVDSRF